MSDLKISSDQDMAFTIEAANANGGKNITMRDMKKVRNLAKKMAILSYKPINELYENMAAIEVGGGLGAPKLVG